MSSNPDDPFSRHPHLNPRPRTRPPVTQAAPPATEQPPVPAPEPVPPEQKTIRVMVNGKEKRRATGPHEEGWCRPPVEHRFKRANKASPGRPSGSKSQDSLLRAELNAKQVVRVGGRDRRVTKRALAAKLFVNTPLEKRDHKQLSVLNAEARRLHPEPVVGAGRHEAYNAAVELQVLKQLMEHLQFGDANPDGVDPLADLATGGPELGEGGAEDAWSEGEWDAGGDEASDDDQ